ncbi:MAG: ribonuclease H-like domain-containing protein [Myxococcota bacterium]|nr:ribonuclease H-like domain-containing protein [Myxococcota bacterium]
MSRLRDKLSRRQSKGSTPLTSATRDASDDLPSSNPLIDQLKKRMEKITAQGRSSPHVKQAGVDQHLGEALPGEVVETDRGEVLVNTKTYPAGYCYGQYVISDFLKTGPGITALCPDEICGRYLPRGALFLDTETTGLARGTGTLPFLIGIGWFEEDDTFSIKQLFCREPSEEQAQLEILKPHLERATCLVTFNGKAFDLPLINTRFVLHRQKNPAARATHLDLLFAARRVFKRRLSRVGLGHLESAVLGYERIDDIPGHAIPAAYAAYLRGGSAAPLAAVLDHNALDLVGLAALGVALDEMYRDPAAVAHAADHLGLAKAAITAGQGRVADKHLERAVAAPANRDSRDAWAMAAEKARKQGDLDQAKVLWQAALTRFPDDSAAHLALAKYYEHTKKDLNTALYHAKHTSSAEGSAASAHRIARISRRLKRQGANFTPHRDR